MRSSVMAVLLLVACKTDQKTPPAPAASPSPAPVMPPPTPTPVAVVAADAAIGDASSVQEPEPPRQAAAIVVWRGGGETPVTQQSIRVWPDGTVRFRCGQTKTLPRERVDEMLATLAKAGWAARANEPSAGDGVCISTTVQVTINGTTDRRRSACETVPGDLSDAVALVEKAVAPDPCP